MTENATPAQAGLDLGENDAAFLERVGKLPDRHDEDIRLYALASQAETLRRERDEAREELDRMSDEIYDLRQTPWPSWAEACLKLVRDCNGSVENEVDLPEELEEILSEWDDYEKKWRAETARADTLAREAAAKDAEIAALKEALEPFAQNNFYDMQQYMDACELATARLAPANGEKGRDHG